MLLLSRFNIQGHSMEPNFHPGDFVVVSSIPYCFIGPKIRDVVLFKDIKTQKYIIKRIVKIKSEKYIVKGDNIEDSKNFEPISKEEVVGKVVYKI